MKDPLIDIRFRVERPQQKQKPTCRCHPWREKSRARLNWEQRRRIRNAALGCILAAGAILAIALITS